MATRSAAGTCSQYERSSLRSCNRRLVTTRAISDTSRILPGPADGVSVRTRTLSWTSYCISRLRCSL